jgi:hypothetical protein
VQNFVRLLVSGLILTVILLGLTSAASAQVEPRPARKGTRYTVTIDSSPQQAAIYLDDKKYGIVGYTPYRGKLHKGSYKLILELPGFKTLEKPIGVDSRHRTFVLPLERQELPGTIDIQATADANVNGSSVVIDGQNQGTAPLIVDVKEGRHQVVIKKEGFGDFEQWLDVKQGQRVTLTPVLRSSIKKGGLLVNADVPGAEVTVDNKPYGAVPAVVDNLDEGPHVVEVTKAGAPSWRQTVAVKGGVRVQVTATLADSIAKDGKVRVVSNVDAAEVWIDGLKVGVTPYAGNLAVGDHQVEVRAPGKQPKAQRVTIKAGADELVTIQVEAPGVGPSGAVIRVVSTVPGAKVYIDGADLGQAPVNFPTTPGKHFVTVQAEKHAKFEQEIDLAAGQTIDVTAALKSSGLVRFISTPGGAEVVLDGRTVGKTPLDLDVEAGEHVVTIRAEGFHDFEQKLTIQGGETRPIQATLAKLDQGLPPEVIASRKAIASSFSARTMAFGDFSADLSLGYPYWVDARATVGGSAFHHLGWDFTLGLRSLLTDWNLYAGGRLQFLSAAPFAMAGFTQLGGGSGLDGRNQFDWQLGLLNTVTFGAADRAVTVTGRIYLDFWSDKLCGSSKGVAVAGAPDICKNPAAHADDLSDFGIAQSDILDRDNGIRLYVSFIMEISITDHSNFFFILEGAPGQDPRAGFSDAFTPTLLAKDPIYNGRLGVTFKF